MTVEDQQERQAIELRQAEAMNDLTAALALQLSHRLTYLHAHLNVAEERLPADGAAGCLAALQAASACTTEIAAISQQLVTLARPQKPQRVPFALSAHLRRQLDLMRPALGENLRIRGDVEDDVHLVSDPWIISYVLMHLMAHTAAAMPEGGVVTVRLGAGEDHEEVVLEISGAGVGTGAVTLERIFEPSSGTPGEETGRGLASVNAAMIALGGRISVQCKPGEGTLFRVTLPRTRDSAPGPSASAPELRILVVEDSPTVRRYTVRALELRGFTAVGARDQEELREKIRGFRPHLALVDWNLRGEDATAVIDELRGHEVRTIIVTGDPADVDYSEAPIIDKPINWTQLEEIIRQMVDG